MESAQRELLSVLLKRVFSLGLIPEATYLSARNAVASTINLPELLWDPVRPAKGAGPDGSAQNPG